MLKDRYKLAGRLAAVTHKAEKGEADKGLLRQLASIEMTLETAILKKERRIANIPLVSYQEHLPIFPQKNAIIRAIKKHQVLIISGETGSGKSTQIPKICLEAGQGIDGKVGCTQPRRIAAVTIARRIAEELGEKTGKSVGYKIRFKDKTASSSYIKVLTDGMLLAETQKDRFLNAYDTLIIDEAHERSLNIDFLLGILKTLLPKRKDLKVIISSATIDTERFSEFFDDAPIIEVEGRLYPVEVEYMPMLLGDSEVDGEVTHVDMAVRAVDSLSKKRHLHDILIFMPTEQDIRETCKLLEARRFPSTVILPLFARLTGTQQQRIFFPFSERKIVVSTNVAETSLTIPGIRYVIDTGLARIPRYLPGSRTTNLLVSPISKSSADQRKGRCGRVQNGICIRLYSEEDYISRPRFTAPEILRSNLAEVILRMLFLKLGRITSFPFLDKPGARSIKDGFDLLFELGAVVRKGSRVSLTEKGRIMARIPMDPRISRMMLEAEKEGCLSQMAIIASALSIQDPRERPSDTAADADRMHASFKDPDSDFITLLNIWNQYQRSWDLLKTQNKMRRFCKKNFLSFIRIREWMDIHGQITDILKEQGLDRGKACGSSESLYASIHRSILSGYLSNIAIKKDNNIYLAAKGREVMIFPGSVLFKKRCPWIVAADMVRTSRLFARTAARIDATWLEALGGDLCRSSYADPHWEKKRGEVMANEQVVLFGLVIVSKRSVSYGPVNPEESHKIFIRSALMENDIKGPFPFLEHNRNLIKKIEGIEDKIRRRDILVDDDTVADFYSERLSGVYNVSSLKKLIKQKGHDDFLKMREEDLFVSRPDEARLAAYPDHMKTGDKDFRLSYRFTPGKGSDGVTISIPSTLACRFPSERLEWMVPGLFMEKITALIKGLPKRYRKQLVPVHGTAKIIATEMERTDESLVNALSRFIYKKFEVDIPASEWNETDIPEHLRMRIAITDHTGKELQSDRDFHLLRQRLESYTQREEEPAAWKEARKKWERSDIMCWDFGFLPDKLALGDNLVAYPGLKPADKKVCIRLFTNAETALLNHKKGVECLYSFHFSKELKYLKRMLKLPAEAAGGAAFFGGIRACEKAVYSSFIHGLFSMEIRTEEDFRSHGAKMKSLFTDALNGLVENTADLLCEYHSTRSAIYNIETANQSNRALLELCAEIRMDLDHLMPENFLELYTPERMVHLLRYLKAMKIRVERGAYDVEKDRKKAVEAEFFIKALEKMTKDLSPQTSLEKRQALQKFRWMVEEFKVSMFAQELKTSFPVSKKRLKERAGEIERMR